MITITYAMNRNRNDSAAHRPPLHKLTCCLMFTLLLVTRVSAQQPTPQPPILQIENETASAVAWSPDGTILAVGDSTGVLLYTENLEFIRSFAQPSEQMKLLAWSPDGRYIAASGANDIQPVDVAAQQHVRGNKIYVWEAENGELRTIFDNGPYITGLGWRSNGNWIASGGWDSRVQIWNPLNGHVFMIFSTLTEGRQAHEVFSLAVSPDGGRVAVIASGRGILIWDVSSADLLYSLPNQHPYPPYAPATLAWSPNSELLATGYGVIDIETASSSYFENCPRTGTVAWHPDNHVLALLGRTSVSICDVTVDRVVAELEGGIGQVEAMFAYSDSLDWHPDGKRLAGAAGDGFIRIWHVFND